MKKLIKLLLLFLMKTIVCTAKSNVIIKQEGAYNPINFYEAILKLQHIVELSPEHNKIIINSVDFKNDFDIKSFIIQTLNNISTVTDEIVRLTPICKQLLKDLKNGIKSRDSWALNGRIIK
jgi:hypothetical protein